MGIPFLQLSEEQQEVVGQFRRELHQLIDRMMSAENGIGANLTKELVGEELTYVQVVETNTATLAAFLPSWLEQFRLNHIRTNGFGETNLPTRCRKSALVVGAGPSLTDDQLKSLSDYRGYLICSNKVLERVLEYRIPNMVVVIHTTPDVAAHFKGECAQEHLGKIDVVASTCIHPTTAWQISIHALNAKIHWVNASIPFRTGLDEYMHAMAPDLLTIDTGGNVGIFMCELAEMMGYDTIGILGMESCLELDPKWTNEEAMQNAICYAPEDFPEPFAMNQVFQGYLQTILLWYQGIRERQGMQVFNLTPKGFLYVRRRLPDSMPYMELSKYIEEFK
jgi:hypothetical protein